MNGGRADESRQERWKNGRRTFYDAVRTLTGRYMNARRTPGTVEGLYMDVIRSADDDIFAIFCFEWFVNFHPCKPKQICQCFKPATPPLTGVQHRCMCNDESVKLLASSWRSSIMVNRIGGNQIYHVYLVYFTLWVWLLQTFFIYFYLICSECY